MKQLLRLIRITNSAKNKNSFFIALIFKFLQKKGIFARNGQENCDECEINR
jgi:hypothetical protein